MNIDKPIQDNTRQYEHRYIFTRHITTRKEHRPLYKIRTPRTRTRKTRYTRREMRLQTTNGTTIAE